MSLSQSQAAARRKLVEAARLGHSQAPSSQGRLPGGFFLTDPGRTPDLLALAAAMPAGLGVIYRHFGSPDRDRVARALVAICRRRRLVCLIAADPALAVRVRADGVHWPNHLLKARRPRRHGWIETCSAHSRIELVRAIRAGVDAVMLSAMFESDSRSAPPPRGPLRTVRMAADCPVPVYGLGGVTPENAQRATRGLAGWAAISAVRLAWGRTPGS